MNYKIIYFVVEIKCDIVVFIKVRLGKEIFHTLYTEIQLLQVIVFKFLSKALYSNYYQHLIFTVI